MVVRIIITRAELEKERNNNRNRLNQKKKKTIGTKIGATTTGKINRRRKHLRRWKIRF